jgi:hypothetical protein
MSCEHAHLDGAYVLGALSPGERRDFEQHLAGCATCAQSVREIAGLPGLLARVEPEILEDPPGEEPVPDTLLPSLLAEVRRTQRRRSLVTAGLAAAAAVLVTLGAAFTLGMTGGDGSPAATPTSTSTPTARPMDQVRNVGMQASLAFEGVPWGTRLDLTCRYAAATGGYGPRATTYSLVVHTHDGRSEQVATWQSLPGRTMHLTAATSAARGDIASVEVRAADGSPVLRLAA